MRSTGWHWVARADDHAYLAARFSPDVAAAAAGLFNRGTRRPAPNSGEFVLPMDSGGGNYEGGRMRFAPTVGIGLRGRTTMRFWPRDSLLMWQLQLPDYSTAGRDVPLPIPVNLFFRWTADYATSGRDPLPILARLFVLEMGTVLWE